MSELLRKAFEKHKILKKRPWLVGKSSAQSPHGMNDDAIASWRLAAQRATGAKPHPSYEPNGQMRLLTRGMQSMERFFSAFSNWKNPGIRQLLKEYKIEGKMKGNAFWNNKRDFVDAVKNAKVEKITPAQDAKISYRSRTANKEGLLNLIKGYRSYPKYRNEGTLNAIYDGFSKNAPMDRPLVVDFGDGKRRVFSGNTRMDAAYHSGIDPEVLVVRGKKKNLEAKLHEFKLVRPLKIEKFADAKTRAAVGKSLRRWLEKQPGMDRSAVRSALGARPLMRQITTKKEAARLNRQDFGKQWDSLDEAGKAALQARLGKTATKPGYVHSQASPRIVLINNQPSLLSYRGIKKGGEDRQITRNLRRPFLGRSETLSQRASGNSPKVAEARANGGFAAHVEQPNGASLSTSTNKNTPVQEGFLAPDEKGESALGVYATPLNKIIQRTKDSKKIGMVNKKYPQEHEITQPNGGNLIAIRKYIQGVDGHHYPGNRREFSALREFKSYDKTGEEERRGFLKTGILGAGIAAAGGLAGLGLYKAGVSGASQKLARLTRAVRNASANKAEGVRAAKAAAAGASKQSNVFRDASIEAQALRAQKMKAAPKAPKVKSSVVETKIPENIINSKAPANVPNDPVPVVNTAKSDEVADRIESAAVGKKPSEDFGNSSEELRKASRNSAPPAPPVKKATPAAPANVAPEKPSTLPPNKKLAKALNSSRRRNARRAKPPAAPAPAPVADDVFWEKPGRGKIKLIGTAEEQAKQRKSYDDLDSSGGFNGQAVGDIQDRVRAETMGGAGQRAVASSAGNSVEDADDFYGIPKTKKSKSNKPAGTEKTEPSKPRKSRKSLKEAAAILRGMKAFNFQADEGGIPYTGKVAKDRFIKKLRDEDLDRRDANILRAGAAGSLAGLLLKGKLSAGKRALIGAGLGGAGVIATRLATSGSRDIYGERSRGAKRAELAPALAGLGVAGYLASRRLRGLSAKLRGVKEFSILNKISSLTGLTQIKAGREALERAKSARKSPLVAMTQTNPPGGGIGVAKYPHAREATREARRLIDEGIRRRNISIGVGTGVAGAAGAGYLATRKKDQKQLAAKFFEKKKEKKELNPYVGAALSGGASGAVLGGLSIFKRNVSPLQALRTAGKFGAVSAGIVGGGALLGSRIVGKPREDESAPFTKRAGLGGAIAGAGAGLAGAVALRKTKGGARVLVNASKNWRPAMWIRKSPLAAGAAVGTVGGALYGGAQGLDEGQQVDSIRNLKKDMKTVASEHGDRVWKNAARTSVHGFSRKEFQFSPLPDVEPIEVSYARRQKERGRFVRNASILGAIGLAGVGGYRFGKVVGRAQAAGRARGGDFFGGAAKSKPKSDPFAEFWRRQQQQSSSRYQDPSRGYDSDYARRSAEAKAQWKQSSSASSGTRARSRGDDANPYAGTAKADAWDKWRAMDRMSKESQMPGEREAAEKMKAAWKKKHNLARKLRSVKFFGRDDQPRYRDTKAWADPITGWVTGADLVDKDGNPWKPSSPQLVNAMVNRAQRERIKVQRGYGLTKDATAVLQGKERERDSSGRIKKREWEKSWFKNAMTTAGLATAGLVGAGMWRYGRANPKGTIGRFVGKTEEAARQARSKVDKGLGNIMRGVDDMTGKRGFMAGKKSFSAKLKLRQFDVIAEEAGWDVRDPRGRSARVFAPGSRRRERREKAWHEKTENERKLWKTGIAAGILAGGLGGVGIYRLAKGKPLIPKFSKPVGSGGNVEPGPSEWFNRVRSAFKK